MHVRSAAGSLSGVALISCCLIIAATAFGVTEPPASDDAAACAADSELVEGTDAADQLNATQENTCVVGLGGNDRLQVQSAANDFLVLGGSGDDRITVKGFPENGLIAGGDDDDFVRGGKADDTVYGGEGNDELLGNDGDDFLFGGPGDDVLFGDEGFDYLDGGSGDDLVIGNDFESLHEAERNSRQEQSETKSQAVLEAGDEREGIANILIGGGGNDILIGTPHSDIIFPGPGQDEVRTFMGDDVIVYSALSDLSEAETIDAGPGFDRLFVPASAAEIAALGIDISSFESLAPFADLNLLSFLVFRDPERNSNFPTGWNYFYSRTRQELNDFLNAENSRIVEVDRVGPDEFRAVTVVNSPGTYFADGTFWLPDLDELAVTAAINFTDTRLIDIEPYADNGIVRFTASFKPNKGTAFKPWIWGYDKTTDDIGSLDNDGWRIIDLESYVDPDGDVAYAYVAIPNSGVDETDETIFINTDFATLNAWLTANPDRRLLDIGFNPEGGIDAIAVTNEGVFWWWGVTDDDSIARTINNKNARLIDIEFRSPGTFLDNEYAFVAIDNATEESRRIRPFLDSFFEDPTFGPTTDRGFIVKEVDGPIVAEIGSSLPTNTASTIKLAAYLAAIQEIDRDNASLDGSTVTLVPNPAVPDDECYLGPGTPILVPYRDALPTMIWLSHSQTLNAFYLGLIPPFADDPTVDTLTRRAQTEWGMTDTVIFSGCPESERPWLNNRSSMRDIVALYESVMTLRSVSKESSRDIFVDNLIQLNNNTCPSYYPTCTDNQYVSPYLPVGSNSVGVPNPLLNNLGMQLTAVIQSERPDWGSTEINNFLNEVVIRGKGGGACVGGPTPPVGLASDSLLVSLPYKTGDPLFNLIVPRNYVVAVYANNFDCSVSGSGENSDKQALQAESLRIPVREAVATW